MATASPVVSQPSDQTSSDFDPSQPSIPVSYPIKTLEELESKSYFSSFHYPFNKASVPLDLSSAAHPDRPRILVCHDFKGGYIDDKWVQGGTNADAYAIWHWYLIDVFVYFSHDLITLPPPTWVNAAHKHGVKVLGTFITEHEEGSQACDKLLATKESARLYAELLAELAVALGFDGWLINIEVPLGREQIPSLKEFLSHLTNTMHSSKPGSLVIWYDSVTVDGGPPSYQNRLNDKNKPFFDLCDGLFTNYWWQESYPQSSAEVAGDRKFDVYTGIDVFGRGTYGGGRWNTNVALDVIKKADVSTAIFAPGWVYENATEHPSEFQSLQNRWWGLVEDSWEVLQKYPKETPFYSDFDQGRGHHISVDGRAISTADWCNLSLQSFQPFPEFSEDHAIQVFVDPEEESYSGGGNLTFKGRLERNSTVTKRLFLPRLLLKDHPLHFEYSVKSEGESQIGIWIELTPTEGKTVSVLLASQGNTLLIMNQFSSKFDEVIMPHQVTKVESPKPWTIHAFELTKPHYTLTKIQAICYKEAGKKPDYYAVLGHIAIKTPGENVIFPPASAWEVEGQSVKWEAGSLSINILWRLKEGNDQEKFQKYRVYVEKVSEADGSPECLGTALVKAFYVSKLPVPRGTASLKFIIQVCGVDGTYQQLEDSPSFQLYVQG